jgi:CubicO group peptidase (beta-lactamase class C family)
VGALGAHLDSQLRRFAEYGFSGSVLVVRDRRVVLLKGYGLADVARGVRNSAATRFEMNSMTKMFTGVSILQLAAAGRLQLSDRVEQHLGEFPPGKRGATIEQLTSHTSGLIVEGTNLAGDPREAFVRDIKQSPREAPPGEQYRYTNAGYSLLGVIIEIASGQRYEAYLREHIFAPAGMRTAVFRDQVPERDPLFAHGYVGTPARLDPGPPNPYAWGTRGAGGVWTTVGDMYRWLVSVEDSGTISGPQRKLLYSPPKPPSEEAFGWHVSTGSPAIRARIDKGGGSDDFASQLLYYPNERVAIIWASNNLRQRWRQTLNQALPAIVFGDSVLALPRIAVIPRDALTDYAGRYFSGGATLVFRTGRNYLYAETNTLDVPTNVMFFPEDRDNFTGYDPSTRRFTRLHFARDDRQAVVIDLANGGRVEGRR